MFELDSTIPLNRDTIKAKNLTDRLTEQDLTRLGNFVWEGYNRDDFSRSKWRKRTQAAMDLAMQVQKEKNFPWPGCSNVAFPLVTIATLQFHSRAYPAIISGRDVVRCRVNGPDPDGKESQRALRVSDYMSYQVLEEDCAWEEQHDRLLINIPIVGCAFKKTYHSGGKGHNVSELVLAQDFVIDYFAKSVESAARKSHLIPQYRNDIHEGIMLGIYRDVSEETWYKTNAVPMVTKDTIDADKRHGMTIPNTDEDTPYTFIEQHVGLDLDKDGYKEPYIVTIEMNSRCVVRLVTGVDRMEDVAKNSKGQIIKVTPTQYFTKYGFIPSPDGGIYDIGFGVLLGPLNESVNSILNQLIDAGTMANSGGGFLGRGAKIRGGVYTFAPLEWKRVDSTGDDLRKSIFPLPVREPSAVLFQLLSLLITYTQRISGTTEAMLGESTGQNTPAQTTQSMVEQGMKIYNAIFKRVWRSMKEEFKKLYILNAVYMPDFTAFGPQGQKAYREDFLGDPNRITPVADPNITSEQQRIQQALMLKQSAQTTPGYNVEAVERNFLQAMRVDGVDVLYPGPEKMPPPGNPKVEIEKMKAELKQMQLQFEAQKFAAELMEERRLNTAKILQLEAQSAKLLAEADGVTAGHEIAAFQTAIGALKTHDDMLRGRIETMMKQLEMKNESNQPEQPPSNGPGMGGLAAAPSDLVPTQALQGMAAPA